MPVGVESSLHRETDTESATQLLTTVTLCRCISTTPCTAESDYLEPLDATSPTVVTNWLACASPPKRKSTCASYGRNGRSSLPASLVDRWRALRPYGLGTILGRPSASMAVETEDDCLIEDSCGNGDIAFNPLAQVTGFVVSVQLPFSTCIFRPVKAKKWPLLASCCRHLSSNDISSFNSVFQHLVTTAAMPLSHLTLTVSHLPTSTSFFLSCLQPLGYQFIGRHEDYIGFGQKQGEPADFWITEQKPG